MLLAHCVIAHLALAMISPSPWGVPDLTLIGLVLSVGASPAQWLVLSGGAGLVTMVWAVRSSGPMFVGYLLIGLACRIAGRQWDATDLRIETGLVAAGSLLLALGGVWLDDLWSPILLAFVVARTALTCSMVPVVHHLAKRTLQGA